MRTTRRGLLRMTGMAAGGLALAACGGNVAASPSPAAPTAAATSAATVAPTATPTPTPQPSPTVALLKGCAVGADDPARPLFVDTHTHLDGQTATGSDYEGAGETALASFVPPGVRTGILMPMPLPPTNTKLFDLAELVPVVARCKQRLALGAGGGSLQPTIVGAPTASAVTADFRKRFEDKAMEIAKAGAVVYGEMAAHHLSFNANHPYESIPADHQLFLLLAEIAAKQGLPIDLHLDAITQDIATPPVYRQLSPNNPAQLKENIRGLEGLLDHAKDAKVVWAHVGADQTGHSTPALYKRLMQAHANLVLQMKINITTQPGRSVFSQNDVLDASDKIRAEWLEVIHAFPDRIVLGGDNFHAAPGARQPFPRPTDNSSRARLFLQQLPADLAKKLASENAVRIYKLG